MNEHQPTVGASGQQSRQQHITGGQDQPLSRLRTATVAILVVDFVVLCGLVLGFDAGTAPTAANEPACRDLAMAGRASCGRAATDDDTGVAPPVVCGPTTRFTGPCLPGSLGVSETEDGQFQPKRCDGPTMLCVNVGPPLNCDGDDNAVNCQPGPSRMDAELAHIADRYQQLVERGTVKEFLVSGLLALLLALGVGSLALSRAVRRLPPPWEDIPADLLTQRLWRLALPVAAAVTVIPVALIVAGRAYFQYFQSTGAAFWGQWAAVAAVYTALLLHPARVAMVATWHRWSGQPRRAARHAATQAAAICLTLGVGALAALIHGPGALHALATNPFTELVVSAPALLAAVAAALAWSTHAGPAHTAPARDGSRWPEAEFRRLYASVGSPPTTELCAAAHHLTRENHSELTPEVIDVWLAGEPPEDTNSSFDAVLKVLQARAEIRGSTRWPQ